jgi:hypothetical protein
LTLSDISAAIEILEIKKAVSQKNPAIKLTYQINKLFMVQYLKDCFLKWNLVQHFPVP